MDKKKLFYSCLCRPPSRAQDELQEVCTVLNLLLSNMNEDTTLSAITYDFNARSVRSLDK